MSKIQTININGEQAVVLPIKTYARLVEQAEMLADIAAYDSARARIDSGEELFPAEVVHRILDGETPVRVFRQYRGLSQKDLAESAGVSVAAISKLERTGKAHVSTLAAIAKRLDLTVDDLLPAAGG
jgi:DNA-binding Xre family transcriptional regulator